MNKMTAKLDFNKDDAAISKRASDQANFGYKMNVPMEMCEQKDIWTWTFFYTMAHQTDYITALNVYSRLH